MASGMSRPFLTIVVDTYNHERFIAQAIESVISQDFQNSEREILVVDDGSIDETPTIVQKFEPHVRLLRKVNGGQASAFNVGISEARGEVVAFLDGDDWWAPGKLSRVAAIFAENSAVGLVGHGLTEVHPDGSSRVETPRDICSLKISSVQDAKKFRMLRGFLGTSRSSYRKAVLDRIGPVPEVLKFEADEYLFTLAGFFADVSILNEALTFYRLHGGNLYQIMGGNDSSVRRKWQVIVDLEGCLRKRLEEVGIPFTIVRPILETVEVEADILRLKLDSGWPWETISTELKIMRIFHSDASFAQHLFSCLRLLPAIALPAHIYYRFRARLSSGQIYQEWRQRFMPFPLPSHVKRIDKPAPNSNLRNV